MLPSIFKTKEAFALLCGYSFYPSSSSLHQFKSFSVF